ncbi:MULTISPECIES: flagellar motor switch protein FliN [unclassified Hydrogenobaculum]|uniref:flagellar motor switch protein FliN n=1 Tax=unclassified Hydrogenobaculum TaxID=2622382 RepID=UPI0001C5031C|nr:MULTISPECIES: flagellar motor switch protein FliN [unclassified Hydrogenobaculum]AEF18587.1 flagellar motor switch protein FliN [Hydrogenobaculum sp. 3684]AEG45875.1 flagellar motor switch protein FliN [Hydrogenobaculum sp. SHO]AGG14518.1 flagellar motor switch protein FliN [Hydrogenobaculum sp. HO]AGH92819.1 flagellar motor switch protein FliN [Hydrogenobaculum sp. SN]
MPEEEKQDKQPEELKEEENKAEPIPQNDEDLMKLWEEAMQAQAQTESSTENQQPQATVQEQDISKELQRILDIPLSITVVIGTTVITIKELLNLRPGSVVALDESINSFVSVYANGKLIAKAELVVVGENFGIRIAEIIEKEDRVKSLASH